MKKITLILLICTLLLSFFSCVQPDDNNSNNNSNTNNNIDNGTNNNNNNTPGGDKGESKTHLVEKEDYLDLTSGYNGESIEYDESMWYMNNLTDVPLPDPFVYVEDETYYIVGTNDANINVVDCYVTTDFVNYEIYQGIYDPMMYDGWENDNASIYAPEIYLFDGVYYMYYSAKDEDNVRRCSVVVADNPLGPYEPLVNDEVDGLNNPLFEHEDYPNRALDATVFTDDDGKMYIYLTVTTDTQHIIGMELITPYMADWSTYKALVIPQRLDSESEDIVIEWEGYRDNKIQIAEAPFMIKSEGKYYLTYSTNGCWNKYYNVCYAVSDSPLGNFVKPYEEGKMWTNLLLGCPSSNDTESAVYNQWIGFASGTGHHCFFYAGDELMIGYHAHQNRNWNSKYFTERYFAFDYVYFDENGVPFCNGPTYSIVNLPGAISGAYNIADKAEVSAENVKNAEAINDNYIVDCYNLDSKDREVALGEGKSYIELTFDKAYEIHGILLYNSAYFEDYIIEIEYLDFGNGNIIYYPQFCEDFYVNTETEFIYPASCFNIEILKYFEAENVKIGFNLPLGGSINEVVILGK